MIAVERANRERAEARIGTLLKGKWRLDMLLGVGGMAAVYAATHRNKNRAAVKVLHPDLAAEPAIRARFHHEGYAANAVGHPCVVRILDDDETDDGLAFLVMELLEGETYDRIAQRCGGRLPTPEVLTLALAVLDVLVAAHEKRILHRDLKPENIFLTLTGTIKVLDFGLARALEAAVEQGRIMTSFGTTMGTPGFMPPEQARGDWNEVDATSDLWAVGATLYTLLSGCLVHEAGNLTGSLIMAATKPVGSLALVAPSLPRAVIELVDRSLQFDKANRFQDAAAMRAAVTDAMQPTTRVSPGNTPEPHRLHGKALMEPRVGTNSEPATVAIAGAKRPLPPTLPTPPDSASALAPRAPLAPEASLGQLTPSRGTSGPLSPAVRPPAAQRPTPPQQTDRPEVVSPIEIAKDTFWVGKRDPKSIFHANPYLRIFRPKPGFEQAGPFHLLVDPGSSSDFAVVSAKIGTLIGGMNKLSALFINHQDPDVGSSAAVISARYAPGASIVCSEATWRLIVHFNLPPERYVDTARFPRGFDVPTGHMMLPVPSPFCHFRGAVMLYDPETRVLFTGDLFGGLTPIEARGLWADESDWAGIRAFHQTYMPTNRVLTRAMDTIRALDPPVEIIAPQHGRLLRGPLLHRYIERLARLPVGLDILDDVADEETLTAWNSVLRRVVRTARMVLGPEADELLQQHEDLRDTLQVHGDQVRLSSLGRWTLSAVVEALTVGQTPTIANPIKLEAVLACEELELPSPDIRIEDAESSEHVGA
ncbi:protein kinase domain-containing protein [Polyangium sorediatum]|uniref:Protein kinase n=1 Tax=Polyangium sorediatum TaxID=889274 RepID=A0ABT6NKX4_9BACT|nr:protein kinase [Polyangium sorediatum]MDI1428923.1 protein kinase [Polyangium sorediatum]